MYLCSNIKCNALYADDRQGHCPACKQDDGSGWSTTRLAGVPLGEPAQQVIDNIHSWLNANHKHPGDVQWAVFPIGMVQRWIERAIAAEKERDDFERRLFRALPSAD